MTTNEPTKEVGKGMVTFTDVTHHMFLAEELATFKDDKRGIKGTIDHTFGGVRINFTQGERAARYHVTLQQLMELAVELAINNGDLDG